MRGGREGGTCCSLKCLGWFRKGFSDAFVLAFGFLKLQVFSKSSY